jgi:thymidylate kinase
MLWHYPRDCTIQRLGDRHLIHLLVSWFHLFDACVLRPHLEANEVVLVDRWFYKYVARFALKPAFHATDVETWFDGISVPDVVFSLVLAPEIAWLRKPQERLTESDGRGSRDADRKRNFVDYQTNVQEILSVYALRHHWRRIESSRPLDEVSAEAGAAILSAVPGWLPDPGETRRPR